jgi:hypothetical protein
MGPKEPKEKILHMSTRTNVQGCLEILTRSKATQATPVRLSFKKTSFLDMPHAFFHRKKRWLKSFLLVLRNPSHFEDALDLIFGLCSATKRPNLH